MQDQTCSTTLRCSIIQSANTLGMGCCHQRTLKDSTHGGCKASKKLGAIQMGQREKRVALLQTIPGIGPITASAIVATVGTDRQFGNGRDFAAWLGLTPLNRSSGEKERLGRISKMGDRYIRRFLVLGMMSRMRQITSNPERYDPWFAAILARNPGN